MSAAVSTGIRVDHVSATHVAARTARAVATAIGLPAPLPDRAAVIASELASNLDKHTSGGSLYVQRLLLGTGIDISAVDRGPGMADIDRCLTDGHTTTGTLGVGLGAVRRMATDFSVSSVLGEGTLLSARVRVPDDEAGSGQDHHLDLGHLVLPAEGEEHSGDLLAATRTGSGEWTMLLVDGLGHGSAAAEAALTAERAFRSDPTRPLPLLMTSLHHALRRTRGSAVALVRLHARAVSFCGIGNINAVVQTGTRTHHLMSAPGVAGLRAAHPSQHDLPAQPGDIVVVHSDGLDNAWMLRPPALPHTAAQLIAARLFRDHRRPADDASVLVARLPASPEPRS
jgi:anti-sigma regulatory factor (Ser/Thr protein kinase)